MASGATLLIFTPYSNEPPTANYATLDLRNNHPVLDFDKDTNESAVFTGVMPRNYSGGGLTVYIHFASSTTGGTVDWDVAFERIGNQVQDIDSDGFAAAQSVNNTTVPGTTGHVIIVNVAFTNGAQMDGISVGDSFRVKITRDAVSDTSSADAQLVALEIKET